LKNRFNTTFIKISLFIFFALYLTACDNRTYEMNGSLCYPSEYIPAMTVYLKSTKSGKIYKLVTKEDQKFFKFSNIPYGEYCCYAYTLDKTVTDIDGNKNKASCGFTKAVVCGLSVDCNDHTLTSVRNKKHKKSINQANYLLYLMC
jgi:hypothetical protein